MMLRIWIYCWIFVFLSVCRKEIQAQSIKDDVAKLAIQIANSFSEIRKFMDVESLAKTISVERRVVTTAVVIDILKKVQTESSKIVDRTTTVVNNLKKNMDTLFDQFSKKPLENYALDCKENGSFVHYMRSKNIQNASSIQKTVCNSPQKLPLTRDPFVNNIPTNRDVSTVHIPTNVYYAGRDIQKVAEMTEPMDAEFLKQTNAAKIQWQYFCSDSGFFRIYPGVQWNIQVRESELDNTKVDFFDCRSEQWYLESTAYPKKMVIIVDKSGSMKGRRTIIANHTINEILNTLTENDFFNIILLGKLPESTHTFADQNITSDKLVRATAKNKKFMMEQLAITFKPSGIAEYDRGLNISLELLNKDKKSDTSTDIFNYLLMIVSDGSPSNFQDIIIDQMKNLDIRIFTYLIGQGITEAGPVREMACNNKGFAVEIATLADVKENVQKYLKVVARKNSLMSNSFNIWTGVHQNQIYSKNDTPTSSSAPAASVVSVLPNQQKTTYGTNLNQSSAAATAGANSSEPVLPDKKIDIAVVTSIKMYVSSAKATFNTTAGELLGAVGVDVPIKEFQNTAPNWVLGVNAYMFGVTNNGFVLFHPRFRPQFKEFMKYFYRNVDISEVEIPAFATITEIPDNEILVSELRDKLINLTSSVPAQMILPNLTTFDILDDFKTAFPVSRNYFIVGIKNTPYKFGLAVPDNYAVPIYKPTTPSMPGHIQDSELLEIISPSEGVVLAFFEFCKQDRTTASWLLENNLLLLKKVLSTPSLCTGNDFDRTYVSSVYKELVDTKGYVTLWKKKSPQTAAPPVQVQQIFSMHHFGVLRYYNYKNLSYENFIRDHNYGTDDPFYKETILTAQALNDFEIMVVKPIPNAEVKKGVLEKDIIFTVMLPIYIKDLYVGVEGVQVEHSSFNNILQNSPLCANKSLRDCYVITSSGVIVFNTVNYRHTGEMLKDVDCSLMERLTNASVFKSQELYDFQGMCPNQTKQTDGSAGRLMEPFYQMWKISIWVIYELIILIQNVSFTSLFWSLTTQEGPPSSPSSALEAASPLIMPTENLNENTISVTKTSLTRRQHQNNVRDQMQMAVEACEQKEGKVGPKLRACIQKVVTSLCRQDTDKPDVPMDAEKSPETGRDNSKSHCAIACALLQAEQPEVWLDQDECMRSMYLCRLAQSAYTAAFHGSFVHRAFPVSTNPVAAAAAPATATDNVPPAYPLAGKLPPATYFSFYNAINNPESSQSTPPPRLPSANFMTPPPAVAMGTICSSCNKTWYVAAIAKTNLLLVVVEKTKLVCNCECRDLFGQTVEIIRNISMPIINAGVLKPNFYSEFVNFSKTDNSSVCTDAASTRPLSLWTLLCSLFVMAAFNLPLQTF